jgi:myxalamid-type polyketide synthase MxaB
MLRQRPTQIRELFTAIMERFAQGDYEPTALTEFRATAIADAFRFMAQRKNIGKVIVSLEDYSTNLPSRSLGTCLITGGLGALGLALAEHQLDQGHSHLVLLSRSAPNTDQLARLEYLREKHADAHLITVQADVCDQQSLDRGLAMIPAPFPPLTHVFHAAGVLADGLLFDMDDARWQTPLAPKVQGTWNLHRATKRYPIEQFVLFSSIAAILGSPGQGNYAAGNAFLDAFAIYRKRKGLPALSINWGPWAELGMAADPERERQLRARGLELISPQRGLLALDRFMETSLPSVAFMDVDWNRLAQSQSGIVPPLFQNLVTQSTSVRMSGVDHEFQQKLREAEDSEREKLLGDYFAAELSRIMGLTDGQLNQSQPLNEIGMDSLLAMELKNNLERQLAINIPMAAFIESPSISSLAARMASSFTATRKSTDTNNSTASYQPVVLLNAPGPNRLFAIHPLGGNTSCYLELAQYLGRLGITLHACVGRGSNGVDPPHASLEELVATYAEGIAQVQPEGPYQILGWSAGGFFAHRVAQSLQQRGHSIDRLVMLDAPLPTIYDSLDLNDDAQFLFDFTNFANRFLNARMAVSYEQLRGLAGEDALKVVFQEAKEHGLVGENASIDYIRRLVDVGRDHVRFIKGRHIDAVSFPVELIVAEQGEILSQLAGHPLPVDYGWSIVQSENLSIAVAPGDHFSMLLGANAEALAVRIAERIQKKV